MEGRKEERRQRKREKGGGGKERYKKGGREGGWKEGEKRKTCRHCGIIIITIWTQSQCTEIQTKILVAKGSSPV